MQGQPFQDALEEADCLLVFAALRQAQGLVEPGQRLAGRPGRWIRHADRHHPIGQGDRGRGAQEVIGWPEARQGFAGGQRAEIGRLFRVEHEVFEGDYACGHGLGCFRLGWCRRAVSARSMITKPGLGCKLGQHDGVQLWTMCGGWRYEGLVGHGEGWIGGLWGVWDDYGQENACGGRQGRYGRHSPDDRGGECRLQGRPGAGRVAGDYCDTRIMGK